MNVGLIQCCGCAPLETPNVFHITPRPPPVLTFANALQVSNIGVCAAMAVVEFHIWSCCGWLAIRNSPPCELTTVEPTIDPTRNEESETFHPSIHSKTYLLNLPKPFESPGFGSKKSWKSEQVWKGKNVMNQMHPKQSWIMNVILLE